MLAKSRVQTMTVPWRKVCAGLPAVALIGGGIALTVEAGPASDSTGVAASRTSPAIVVPGTMPASPAVRPTAARPATGALVLPKGILPGSSTPVTLDSTGIPVRALKAYRDAVSLIGSADPGCHLDWALLAAIGRVESDHARFAGNRLNSAGVAKPGIIGVSLNGSNGTARITDSDGGRLDRDNVFDRAVGPMQFIPTTWRVAGTDADGDRVKDPQDIADAATAAAVYLCSGPGDLRRPTDLRAALMRYNASDAYVRTVIALADAYRRGVPALPASDLPASQRPSASSASSAAAMRPAKTTPRKPAAGKPATGPSGSIPTNEPRQQPTVTPGTPLPTTQPPTTAEPVPTPTAPTPSVPTSCTPAVPDAALSDAAVPDAAVSDPAVSAAVSDPQLCPAPLCPTPAPLPCVPASAPPTADSLVKAPSPTP